MRRVVLIASVLLAVSPDPLLAYVGPGSGLSAIGAVLAVVAGLFFAIFGFVWYPIKRFVRYMKGEKAERRVQVVREGPGAE